MHQLPCHAQPRLPINPNQIPPANLAMLELQDTTAVKVFSWFLSNLHFFKEAVKKQTAILKCFENWPKREVQKTKEANFEWLSKKSQFKICQAEK